MAGKKSEQWVNRAVNAFENLLVDKRTKEFIQKLRQRPETEWDTYIAWLMVQYKLPANSFDLIKHYVKTNEIEPSKVHGTVLFYDGPASEVFNDDPKDKSIVRESDISSLTRENFSLIFTHETTQPELIDFIKSHWKTDIKPTINASNKRNLKVIKPRINRKIDEELLQKLDDGTAIKDLAKQYNLVPEDISKRIYKLRKRKASP